MTFFPLSNLSLKHIISYCLLLICCQAIGQRKSSELSTYNRKLQSAPLLFMENKGQILDYKGFAREDVLFSAKSRGTRVYLTGTTIQYQFSRINENGGNNSLNTEFLLNGKFSSQVDNPVNVSTASFSLTLKGANPCPIVLKERESSYQENYFLSQFKDEITGVKGYEKITFKNVYPHIDWVIYSHDGFMEYDFLVHPGGISNDIRILINDATNVSISSNGELIMQTALGEVKEKAPISYADGKQTPSKFRRNKDGTIGYSILAQPGKELRIDPSIIWSTYFGSTADEYANGCSVDTNGDVYLSGYTGSNVGIASGGFQNTLSGGYDAFIVKFNGNGNRLWSTYYGGNSADFCTSSSLDRNGNLYISGLTMSTSGLASGGFQNTFGGGDYDAFLAKFTPNGNRLWCTYYGGSGTDYVGNCAIDSFNNVYLVGSSESLNNIASGGFQNSLGDSNYNYIVGDAYLVKFDSNGSRIWSTYYGGKDKDFGNSCSVDRNNNVYISGTTKSYNGIASGGFLNTYNGGLYGSVEDAFLVKFNKDGNRLWGTYYGGIQLELGSYCMTDSLSNIYLCGSTASSIGIAYNGFQNTKSGANVNGYLAKFDNTGNRLWATYYPESTSGCATDNNNNIYLVGNTSSLSGLASGGFQNSNAGEIDAYIVKFAPNGGRLWSSYFGGNLGEGYSNKCVTGKNGMVYLYGSTLSLTGIANNGFQNTLAGPRSGIYYSDAYLVKIRGDGGTNLSNVCAGGSLVLNTELTGSTFQWQLNTGSGFANLSNNSDFSGVSSSSLLCNNINSGNYGYQFRCIIDGNASTIYQLKFENRWTGIASNAWENPANWSCGVVPDGNTDIIINSGPVVLNSNGICRTLTVKPGVSFTVTSGNTLTITH